jgi:YD repeat-containing protein
MTRWLGLGLVAACACAAAGCGTSSDDLVPPPAHWLGYDACKLDYVADDSGQDFQDLRTFDGDGNAVHEVWQYVSQTEIDHEVAYTFADDRPTEIHYSRLGDDFRIDRNTYDEIGQWIRFERDGDFTTDVLDGTIDYAETYTYDDAGHLVRLDFDLNADGTPDPDSYITYVYDASGCLATEDWHYQGERDLETYTMMGKCLPVRIDHDDPVDGVIDDYELFEYDANGRLRTHEGLGNTVSSYEYDDQGRLVYAGEGGYRITLTYDCAASAR